MAHARENGTASPDGGGRYSVVHLWDQWYVACRSDELADEPSKITIMDVPLVVFRGEGGRPCALLDRCAHRNVPLSLGKVIGNQIECPYHGWRFDGGGTCRLVPSLCGPQEGRARRVPVYATREQHGLVWVYMTPDCEPDKEPFEIPCVDDAAYTRIDYTGDFEGTLHATLENILDVPHTAFLHRGLFRSAKERNRITAVVRRHADRVEAQYVGEPRPKGVVGRVLAPGGGEVEHWDRFVMPTVAQVEYRLGSAHLLISDILTPINDFLTRMHAVVMVKLPFGGAVLQHVLRPVAMRILEQDADILRVQTEAVKRFGGEQFVNTPVDLLGPHILRLLKRAQRGDAPASDEAFEERVEMLT